MRGAEHLALRGVSEIFELAWSPTSEAEQRTLDADCLLWLQLPTRLSNLKRHVSRWWYYSPLLPATNRQAGGRRCLCVQSERRREVGRDTAIDGTPLGAFQRADKKPPEKALDRPPWLALSEMPFTEGGTSFCSGKTKFWSLWLQLPPKSVPKYDLLWADLCGSSEVVSELEPNFQEDERPKVWPYWVNCEITCSGKRYIEPVDEKESLYNWRPERKSKWNWSTCPITDIVPAGRGNWLSSLLWSVLPTAGLFTRVNCDVHGGLVKITTENTSSLKGFLEDRNCCSFEMMPVSHFLPPTL